MMFQIIFDLEMHFRWLCHRKSSERNYHDVAITEVMTDLRAVGFLVPQINRDRQMSEVCFGKPRKSSKGHRRRDDVRNHRLARMLQVPGIERRVSGRVNIAA